MPKEFYLTDLSDKEKSVRKERIYELIARLCLKYGPPGTSFSKLTDKMVLQNWQYGDPYPQIKWFRNILRVGNIKWYIKNKIEWKDPIWNGDFLQGLMLNGKIRWSRTDFPTFIWYHNKYIETILMSSPFGGKLAFFKGKKLKGRKQEYKWCSVPAIYLSCDEYSISYLAGFLSGGQPYSMNGIDYIRYNQRLTKYMEFLGIPIEERLPKKNWILISPIWPALFTPKMPECIREIWMKFKNPCNAEIYAPILWKTYVNNNFSGGAIPYLMSRRSIYYKFKDDGGAMDILDRMRVDKNLVALDYRVREMVKRWYKEKNDEESDKQRV